MQAKRCSLRRSRAQRQVSKRRRYAGATRLGFESLEDRCLLAVSPLLVKDIYPGFAGSSPNELTVVGNALYFVARDPDFGTELWKTDGTEAGTTQVRDIVPGLGSSLPMELINFNGALFFTASTSANGREVWKSDGTAAGTVLVKDIWPSDQSGFGTGVPADFAIVNNTLYFVANDGVAGAELWKTDGTSAGTVLVKDIRPGAAGSTPAQLTAGGGILYFTADDGVSGREVWKSDGTAGGTVIVRDIIAGMTSSNPTELTALGSTLFFAAGATAPTELWSSDGTEGGTTLLPTPAGMRLSNLAASGAKVYFVVQQAPANGDLWISDGTPAGTMLLVDFGTATIPARIDSATASLTDVAGTLYFVTTTPTLYELWKSDGTPLGTISLKSFDRFNSTTITPPRSLNNIGATLYFYGGSANSSTNPFGIWTTDGTEVGTQFFTPLTVLGTRIVNLNGSIYVTGSAGQRPNELWTRGEVPLDRFEPNDTFATAELLDAPTLEEDVFHDKLTIHDPADLDYYRFVAATSGDMSVRLVADYGLGNQVLDLYDASQTLLFSVNQNPNEERIIFGAIAGRTYYIRIRGVNGALNPHYTLQMGIEIPNEPDRFEPNDSFAAATPFHGLAFSMSVHAPNNDDYYRFTSDGTGQATIDLLARIESGNLDVEIYDSNQVLIARGDSIDDHERITADVVDGQDYYLRVYGKGDLHANYGLTVSIIDTPLPPDRFEPNDGGSGRDLGRVVERIEENLSIHSENDVDSFTFTATAHGPMTISALFDHQQGDIDLVVEAQGGAILGEGLSVDDDEHVVVHVIRDRRYTIRVSGIASTNPNYTLSISSNFPVPLDALELVTAPDREIDLGLSVTQVILTDLSLHAANDLDRYYFVPAASGKFTINAFFEHDLGDVDMLVWAANGSIAEQSTSTSDHEQVVVTAQAGVRYYVQVLGFESAVQPKYTLSIGSSFSATSGDDTIFLRNDEAGEQLPVYNTDPAGAATLPVFAWPLGETAPLVINTLAGNDLIDVLLDEDVEGPAGGIQLNVGDGVNSLNVRGGVIRIDATASAIGSLDTIVSDSGHLQTARLNQNSLELAGDESKFTLLPGGTLASVLASLNLGEGTILDVTNNDLIIRGTADTKEAIHDELVGLIQSARNGLDPDLITNWSGTGITSSTARASNVATGFDLVSLGLIRNSDLDITTGIPGSAYTSFGGEPVGPHDLLLKYTYIGDANLSGIVSFDDYVGMDNAFFGLIPNLGWATGDINSDNAINFDDYSKVDQAFFFQAAPLAGGLGATAGCLELAVASLSGSAAGGSTDFSLAQVFTPGSALLSISIPEEPLQGLNAQPKVVPRSAPIASHDQESKSVPNLTVQAADTLADARLATSRRSPSRDLWDTALLDLLR